MCKWWGKIEGSISSALYFFLLFADPWAFDAVQDPRAYRAPEGPQERGSKETGGKRVSQEHPVFVGIKETPD